LTSNSGSSARASLIKTRRGTWIDKSLLAAARQECLEILRVASEAVGEDVIKLVRGDDRILEEDSFLSNLYWNLGDYARVWGGLNTLRQELHKYRLPEEERAWELAYDAHETSRMCGCCGRELLAHEPAYCGAKVYTGMLPLSWNSGRKPKICELRYMRTVLCESCAPEWLSQEEDGTVTQLCAHCERPNCLRLDLSELQDTFCSARCQRAYHEQLRKDKRAEGLEKRARELEKVCEVCGEQFTATRRDTKSCSDGCKQRAYRQRKKEAQQNR
jgi:hypothetical protein